MLRRLKMELKRQQQQQDAQAADTVALSEPAPLPQQPTALTVTTRPQAHQHQQVAINGKQLAPAKPATRSARNRRSSKPAMEKRRRARINECLDTLKSYVLYDKTTLNRIGIDASQSENQDEETIARRILKSSGLIHRHKGRKNPNKLEKADILELTVDYVRQLHEQRNELLMSRSSSTDAVTASIKLHRASGTGNNINSDAIAMYTPNSSNSLPIGASLERAACMNPTKTLPPLTLNLPNVNSIAAHMPSPPPSSASNSPQPLLTISSNIRSAAASVDAMVMDAANSILDLSQDTGRRMQPFH